MVICAVGAALAAGAEEVKSLLPDGGWKYLSQDYWHKDR